MKVEAATFARLRRLAPVLDDMPGLCGRPHLR
jgi:hypothetical protein